MHIYNSVFNLKVWEVRCFQEEEDTSLYLLRQMFGISLYIDVTCHNWRTLAHASCILCIDTTATWSGCPTTTWWTRTACTSSPSTWWSAPRTSPGSTSPSMTSRRSPTIFWSEFAAKKKYLLVLSLKILILHIYSMIRDGWIMINLSLVKLFYDSHPKVKSKYYNLFGIG